MLRQARLMPVMRAVCWILLAGLLSGCGRDTPDSRGGGARSDAPKSTGHGHVHLPPHGGTIVVLAEEKHHLEFVRDSADGMMRAYVFDGHLERFLRVGAPYFEVLVQGRSEPLRFEAAASAATGETVGNTSMFECRVAGGADGGAIEGVLKSIQVEGVAYELIPVRIPAATAGR